MYRKSHEQETARIPQNRATLEGQFGRVWNTRELAREFVVLGVAGHHVFVRRKTDGVDGRVSFQDGPRYYYRFEPGGVMNESVAGG